MQHHKPLRKILRPQHHLSRACVLLFMLCVLGFNHKPVSNSVSARALNSASCDPSPPACAKSRIIAFGDSLSDNGNVFEATNHTIPNPKSYWQGRFSNEKIWVEQLAYFLNITLIDFAYGGATACPSPVAVPDFVQQTSMLADPLWPHDIVTVLTGSNDIFNFLAATGGQPPAGNLTELVVELVTTIVSCQKQGVQALVRQGAKNFIIANLPPIHLTPFGHSLPAEASQLLAALISMHNDLLAIEVMELAASYPDVKFVLLDVESLLIRALTHPEDFGFTNVNETCLVFSPEITYNFPLYAAESRCRLPHRYIFWDNVHPTGTVHYHVTLEAKKLMKERKMLRTKAAACPC